MSEAGRFKPCQAAIYTSIWRRCAWQNLFRGGSWDARLARILVIGPGALGVIAAIRLQHAGHDVVLVARSQEKATRLVEGLRVDNADGSQSQGHVRILVHPKQVDAPFDLIVHTTKAKDAESVLQTWLPTFAADGWLVPFQNGLLTERMMAIAPGRVMACAVYYGATLVGEGHSRQTGPGWLFVGPWPQGEAGVGTPAHRVASILNAIVPAMAHADMRRVKWSKLVLNSAQTSLGVVTGLSMHGMARDAAVARTFQAVIREGLAVMAAQDLKPVRVGPANLALLGRLPAALFPAAMRLRTRKHGAYTSSSAQSMARGEPSEVDEINGAIVAAGRKFGVATPLNAALVARVHAIERGEAGASPSFVRYLS